MEFLLVFSKYFVQREKAKVYLVSNQIYWNSKKHPWDILRIKNFFLNVDFILWAGNLVITTKIQICYCTISLSLEHSVILPELALIIYCTHFISNDQINCAKYFILFECHSKFLIYLRSNNNLQIFAMNYSPHKVFIH